MYTDSHMLMSYMYTQMNRSDFLLYFVDLIYSFFLVKRIKLQLGVLWWLSRLRLWHHCCGSGYCCDAGQLSGLGDFPMPLAWKQQNNNKKIQYT